MIPKCKFSFLAHGYITHASLIGAHCNSQRQRSCILEAPGWKFWIQGCPKMGQGGRREGGGGGEGTSPKSPWNSTKSLQNLGTKDIFRALWALLIVLFEIIHEWQLKETDEGKCVGMGMNPRVCGTQVAMRSLSDSHRRELYVGLRVCYLLGTNQTGCV